MYRVLCTVDRLQYIRTVESRRDILLLPPEVRYSTRATAIASPGNPPSSPLPLAQHPRPAAHVSPRRASRPRRRGDTLRPAPSLFPARTTTETTGPRPRDLGSEGGQKGGQKGEGKRAPASRLAEARKTEDRPQLGPSPQPYLVRR
jgi:hypothetical protein